ncbi:hypothetical protein SCHPADRAFT_130254 [Schizopora paradoxa]|uniref:Uncharacterized protein n=1 Tax=Schizopora paradoxa TaxID=27342 RepID=A0A0H2S9A6_9AGAM|nr:hypothetical protein SCHPADRAFT_130254 [Schizopora paradoxa]
MLAALTSAYSLKGLKLFSNEQQAHQGKYKKKLIMSSEMWQDRFRLQSFQDLYTDCLSKETALQQYSHNVRIYITDFTILDLSSPASIGILYKIALNLIELNNIWTYFGGFLDRTTQLTTKVGHVASLLLGRLKQCRFWRPSIQSANIQNRDVVISKISEAENIARSFRQ